MRTKTEPQILTRYIIAKNENDLFHFDIIKDEGKLSYKRSLPDIVLEDTAYNPHLTLLTDDDLGSAEKDNVALLLFCKIGKRVKGLTMHYRWSGDNWPGNVRQHLFFNFDADMLEARKYSPAA